MADLTRGAVDTVLGTLARAVSDEAKLLGGVHGDVQFIKDEMDSMNGFLLHLKKQDAEHDDQLRAWMKQVRDTAYIAEDCIELYMRDVAPPGGGDRGLWDRVRNLPEYIRTMPTRHRVAKQIHELKARVREVGERRQRYGVTVPDRGGKDVGDAKPLKVDENEQAHKRNDFQSALEVEDPRSKATPPYFSEAIKLLPHDLTVGDAAGTIQKILGKCLSDVDASCMKMFLASLCIYPYTSKEQLADLEKKVDREEEPKEQVMIFCYAKLSTAQKSCLQYLTTFLEEKAISRTCLLGRWVAEGIFSTEHGRNAQEAAERCFGELVFRWFIRPSSPDAVDVAGNIKSCRMEESVKQFIIRMAKRENFVSDMPSLPTHLERQLQIRMIVGRSFGPKQKQEPEDRRSKYRGLCGGGGGGGTSRTKEDRPAMDELVTFLKGLPETYRLNVLDLGGCKGLKMSHLNVICTVIWLKYLSLRKSDAPGLPTRRMKALRLLETLDIRETAIPPSHTKKLYLPKLKHLHAGHSSGADTVQMPASIQRMRDMETLSRLLVSADGSELEAVARLPCLRKLGVVLTGKVQADSAGSSRLARAVTILAERLRSLAIWATEKGDPLGGAESSFSASTATSLESLDINGTINLSWIGYLKKLTHISLRDTNLDAHVALSLLGKELPALAYLRFRSNSFNGSTVCFRGEAERDAFQSLKYLSVEARNTMIVFEDQHAAPKLEKISWTYKEAAGTDTNLAITKILCHKQAVRSLEEIAWTSVDGPDNQKAPGSTVTRTVFQEAEAPGLEKIDIFDNISGIKYLESLRSIEFRGKPPHGVVAALKDLADKVIIPVD